jgi:hypothetical protein
VNQLNKIILKTAAEGLVWIVVVFCYGMGVFSAIWPGTMAIFYDAVGNTNLSAMYYERSYQRTQSHETLFLVLFYNIQLDNTDKVIIYGDIFYNELTEEQRKAVLPNPNNEIATTDDYLRHGYIRALIARNNIDLARVIYDGMRESSYKENIWNEYKDHLDPN